MNDYVIDQRSKFPKGKNRKPKERRSYEDNTCSIREGSQRVITAGMARKLEKLAAKSLKEKKAKRQRMYVSKHNEETQALQNELEFLKRKLQEAEKRQGFYPPSPKYHKGMGSEFYKTREWQKLRWSVISSSNGLCQACARGRKDGVKLHVDHIKPRSKFPELELEPSNMQVLCEDCNMGKGAKPQTF